MRLSLGKGLIKVALGIGGYPRDPNVEYMKTFTSFSGTDIITSISFPGGNEPYIFGELHTISYSTHREINPVRTLGRINPAGFVRGPRTIGGSLVFAVFDQSIVRKVSSFLYEKYQRELKKSTYRKYESLFSGRVKSTRLKPPEKIISDEMPPFDITISFSNELGNSASMQIKNVIILNEGQVMSVADIMTENTMQYIAKDIVLLERK